MSCASCVGFEGLLVSWESCLYMLSHTFPKLETAYRADGMNCWAWLITHALGRLSGTTVVSNLVAAKKVQQIDLTLIFLWRDHTAKLSPEVERH